jgi:hypothetical protein
MKFAHWPIALLLIAAQAAVALDSAPAPKSAWPFNSTPAPQMPSAKSGSTNTKIKYTLQRAKDPTPADLAAYERITAAMDKAVQLYDQNSTLRGHVQVQYSPGTPTADGSANGNIRFGGSCNARVAMHEIAHTFGIGTAAAWGGLVKDGIFTGKHATRELREITGDPAAVLHADRSHFWPYGLNYDNEVKSDTDLVNHCKMVEAICKDLKSGR